MFQVKIVPLFSGMKLQEKILFSDVLLEELCAVEDTVTSAEERPLPKEWHLPADISFILGKLAKRRQSQTACGGPEKAQQP